jgi:hypothetical protein
MTNDSSIMIIGINWLVTWERKWLIITMNVVIYQVMVINDIKGIDIDINW